MSALSPPPHQRFLRRAANILNSNGQPIAALQVTSDDAEDSKRPGRPRDSSGIGESIMQKFRSLRRLSSPGRSSSTANSKGHERSQSEVLDIRPEVLRSKSTSDKYSLDVDRVPSLPLIQMPSPLPLVGAFSLSQDKTSSSDFIVPVPALLVLGTPMTKVSPKKQKKIVVKLDPDLGQIVYESKRNRIIPIENIKELRSGSDARYYRQQFQLDAEVEDRWITIIYVLESGYRTLHLVATTKDIFQMWDISLRKMYAVRQQLMSGLGNIEMRQLIWEKQYWKSGCEEKDQKLNFDDVEKMCHRLNINPSRDDMLSWFKTADVQNRGYLDFEDFRRFVKALKTRPELDRLYKKLSKGGPFDYPVFEMFMLEKQKSPLNTTELQRLFAKFISPPQEVSESQGQAIPPQASTNWQTGVWKLKNFTTFLLSSDNSPFSDYHGKIHMDMTRPLSDYYVSTSHNTYLVGHQLVGDSTIEGYIRALLHSCRSVELDVYDGDTEPMIYHGLTLTSKVSVREVCEAIMKYAFVASPYPIIISAEIHCGMVQQDLLAKIMREVFGDALVSAPVNGRPKIDQLPSPEELKGRVLLKAKNLYVSESEGLRSKEVIVDASSTETTSSYETDVLSDVKTGLGKVGMALNRVASKRRRPSQSKPNLQSPPGSPASNSTFLKAPTVADSPDKFKVKMSFELLALLVYTVGVKCRGINKKETYALEHLFSLSETTANKLLKEGMMDLIKHNRTHVVRIYPKGARISSTNYAPHKYWAAGAQLVALNWQTCDLGIMINNAMFQRNGKAGYVLKPLVLCEANKQLLSRRTTHHLKMTIISAQQLPRPKNSSGHEIEKGFIDPYVEVSVHAPDWTQFPHTPDNPSVHHSPSTSAHNGAGTSTRTVNYKTGIVKNNGFNPVWEESFSLPFDCVEGMRDLIFVRFEVKQETKDDDESLAQYVISLGSLLPGYRHLPLHDSRLSQYLFSTLFVHTDIIDI